MAMLGLAGTAQAATFMVAPSSADTAPGTTCAPASGTCSLRELIEYENGLNATPNPVDQIVVPAGVYSLTNGALVVNQSVVIAGAGPRTTNVSQNTSSPTSRVFDVSTTTPAHVVTISGLSVVNGTADASNGEQGGDIRNQGTLTLANDRISNGSTTAGSGGGIANVGGTLTLTHSLVDNNSSTSSSGSGGDSGGIANIFGAQAAQLVIDNSTITNNTADEGGGVMSWSTTANTNTVQISDSTIAENTDTHVRTNQVNSGGLLSYAGGQISVANSIVALNSLGTSSPTTVDCATGNSGTIKSGGYNIESGTDCGFTAIGDHHTTDPGFINIGLQDLGGNTDVIALRATSPAVDAIPTGTPGCSGTDQRGIPRPQGSGCDIGAYELYQPIEGRQFSTVVDSVGCSLSGNVTISWGDGSSSNGTVGGSSFGPVTGMHTYAEEGIYHGTVSFQDDCGTHTDPFDLKVQDAPLTGTASPPNTGAGLQFTGPVATFTDADPAGTASDYAATINWGDGTATAGTIAAGATGFTVTGTHVYPTGGQYGMTIVIADSGGATTTVNEVATVAPAVSATAPPLVLPSTPTVQSSISVAFLGSINPDGSVTTAYFRYGLDPTLRATPGPTYDQQTPSQTVGSDTVAHSIRATVTGLLPNATYHVQLVAINAVGTTYGPDQAFKTAMDPAPPPPTLGQNFDAKPISGTVFIKVPATSHHGIRADVSTVTKGAGFLPLTEPRLIPVGSQIDARAGTLQLVTATGERKSLKTGTFRGGLFKPTQSRSGITKGVTTLTLLENLFRGAPGYSRCGAVTATTRALSASTVPAASVAKSNPILQTLHAQDNHGKFRTRGRYSAGTVRGTIWDTIDSCAGTTTKVYRGAVNVYDYGRRKTVTVRAGHSYLARAFKRRHGA